MEFYRLNCEEAIIDSCINCNDLSGFDLELFKKITNTLKDYENEVISIPSFKTFTYELQRATILRSKFEPCI